MLFGIIFYYIFYLKDSDTVRVMSRSIHSSHCENCFEITRKEANQFAENWGYVIPVYKEILKYFIKEI